MTRPRRDPTGTRALFEASPAVTPQVVDARADEGRTLLYSSAPEAAGTVPVDCGTCGARSRIGLVEVGLRMVPSLFVPLRRYPHWMRCPSCERRTWCRIGWTS